eukprot:gene25802-53756_t
MIRHPPAPGGTAGADPATWAAHNGVDQHAIAALSALTPERQQEVMAHGDLMMTQHRNTSAALMARVQHSQRINGADSGGGMMGMADQRWLPNAAPVPAGTTQTQPFTGGGGDAGWLCTVAQQGHRFPCFYFKDRGDCHQGDACNFSHDAIACPGGVCDEQRMQFDAKRGRLMPC